MGWLKKRKQGNSLKDLFFSKEKNFYKMLSDQTSKTLEGIEALRVFAQTQHHENGKRVKGIEKEADSGCLKKRCLKF